MHNITYGTSVGHQVPRYVPDLSRAGSGKYLEISRYLGTPQVVLQKYNKLLSFVNK
jgi:hypothetical protein